MAARDHDAELDQLKKDIEALRNDLSGLSGSVSGTLGEELSRLAEQVRTRAGSARDAAGERVRQGLDTATTTIEERPLASMAVAFGVGLLIGKLIDRR